MAKVSSKSSSKSVRKKKKKGSGGDAAWKHSPVVGILLVAVIGFCIYRIIFDDGGIGESLIPDNFPHTYLAVEDNGKREAVIIKRGKKEVKTPFTENGKQYWEAYLCHNENCPGRPKTVGKKKKKKDADAEVPPFIFAGARPEIKKKEGEENKEPEYGIQTFCPKCKAAYAKASKKKKQEYDLGAIERYQTDEALKIIEQIRAEYRKRAGN